MKSACDPQTLVNLLLRENPSCVRLQPDAFGDHFYVYMQRAFRKYPDPITNTVLRQMVEAVLRHAELDGHKEFRDYLDYNAEHITTSIDIIRQDLRTGRFWHFID